MANNTLKLAFILSATDKMSRIVDEAVKKSTDKLSAFERTTSKIGRSMMNAGTVMAGAGAAVGASIFAVGKASADYAGDMFDMARSTGMGVESFQKIAYAAKMSGIEAEKVTTSFIKFDKMAAVIDKITRWVQENPELAATIGNIAMTVGKWLAILGTAAIAIGGATFIVGQFGKVFRTVSDTIKIGTDIYKGLTGATAAAGKSTIAYTIGQKMAAAAQWLFNTALFGCPVIWIVAGIMAIIAAVVLLVKYWDEVAAWFKKLWDSIVGIFKAAWEAIKKVWGAVTGWFSNLWGGIKAGVGKAWEGIKNTISKTREGVQKAWGSVKGWFSNLWNGVKNVTGKAWQGVKSVFLNYTPYGLIYQNWDKVTGYFSNLWGNVKSGISTAWGGIKDWFSNMQPVEWMRGAWENVGTFFSGLNTRFYEWGKNLLQGLWNGITSMVDKIVEGMKNIARKIATGFRSILGINSPSRLFAEYGLNITQGLAVGLDQGGAVVENATDGVAMQATRGITQSMQSTTMNASTIVSGGNTGPSITYAPQITFAGSTTREARDEFGKMLKQHANEIMEMIRRYEDNKARLSFT